MSVPRLDVGLVVTLGGRHPWSRAFPRAMYVPDQGGVAMLPGGLSGVPNNQASSSAVGRRVW